MARYHHNIEPSGFRSGEYVGYAGGKVYNIRKLSDGSWYGRQAFGTDSVGAKTLKALSRKLEDK